MFTGLFSDKLRLSYSPHNPPQTFHLHSLSSLQVSISKRKLWPVKITLKMNGKGRKGISYRLFILVFPPSPPLPPHKEQRGERKREFCRTFSFTFLSLRLVVCVVLSRIYLLTRFEPVKRSCRNSHNFFCALPSSCRSQQQHQEWKEREAHKEERKKRDEGVISYELFILCFIYVVNHFRSAHFHDFDGDF